MPNFSVIETNGVIIKAWDKGVQFEEKAIDQLKNVASLPFVKPYVAAMPDTHWGMGCTVGSVIPTVGAIIPAAVGVDIGCGMMAVRTDINIGYIKQYSAATKDKIEKIVPCGRTNNGGEGDRGAWHDVPEKNRDVWNTLFKEESEKLFEHHPGARSKNAERHLGTLGTGNHFIEVSADEQDRIWIVLHSGSRGFGNRIGTYFTNLAKEICGKYFVTLPDSDLSFFPKGTVEYGDYIYALHMAQNYAWQNRRIMMEKVLQSLWAHDLETVHCHHNYMSEERHFGQNVILTRKGAVDAGLGKMVIIPGSMGARSYIARGLGSRDSFNSCSHGAGRAMGRKAAEKFFTLEDHKQATVGIECDKTLGTLDETPGAYKNIHAVMAAQTDLVETVHVLRQIVNVKGISER